MIGWLRALFAWREIRRTNHHSYQQNGVTGERRVRRFNYTPGWMAPPPDEGWVRGLEFGEEARSLLPRPPASDA